jgi:hypothetical protein
MAELNTSDANDLCPQARLAVEGSKSRRALGALV